MPSLRERVFGTGPVIQRTLKFDETAYKKRIREMRDLK